MTDLRPRRSVLYMPGSNARALEKAKTLDADCLILDLEDAVAPDAKEQARDQVYSAVKSGDYGARELIIRINGLDTPWGETDFDAAMQAMPNAILVPKVNGPEVLRALSFKMAHEKVPEPVKLWAMMETPLAMLNAASIAANSKDPGSRFAGMVMGTNDLAKETRARLVPGREPMLGWLSTAIAAARAYGLLIIDGVYNDIDDMEGFGAECRQGLEMGMDGKTLIHPKQLEDANRIFAPTDEEVSWARTVIDAFEQPENARKGALRIDGRMVERLHADMARQTVAIADAIDRRKV